ncbi:terpene synthase family protein [Streptomyces sp. NPDC058579]|uniref:terpene synthase family protein n=1 Tax=Streptomyces sp. NPDC058579 TaxID=3346548 RepID=UPI003662D0D7
MKNYNDLAERHRDRIPGEFNRWVRHFGIQEEIAPILYTVATWVKHCSWPAASEEQRALACMDLAVSFFYLDDYQHEDYPELFSEFRRNLTGEQARSTRPIVHAHADLIRRLRESRQSMEKFIELRGQLLDEYLLRNSVMRGTASADFDRYWQCRLVTIYVQQWMELWFLIWDFPLAPEEHSSPLLHSAMQSATVFYFLGNDLYSYKRDAAKGEPNLVCLWRYQHAVSTEEAASAIDRMRREALDRFNKAFTVLTGERSPENLKQCGHLLQHLVNQATTARHDNPERYVKPDQLLNSEVQPP